MTATTNQNIHNYDNETRTTTFKTNKTSLENSNCCFKQIKDCYCDSTSYSKKFKERVFNSCFRPHSSSFSAPSLINSCCSLNDDDHQNDNIKYQIKSIEASSFQNSKNQFKLPRTRRRNLNKQTRLSLSSKTMTRIYIENKSMLSRRILQILIAYTILPLLLCDIQAQIGSPALVAASEDLTSSAVEVGAVERFQEEPEDKDVLLGQPTEIKCLIVNKNGILSWFRGDFAISRDADLISTFRDRYSLPYATNQPNETSSPSSSSSKTDEINTNSEDAFANYISNYNLHISNVTLRDDAPFRCRLSHREGGKSSLTSRIARISVLKAPTSLTLHAENLTSMAANGNSPFEPKAKLEIIDLPAHYYSAAGSNGWSSKQQIIGGASEETPYQRGDMAGAMNSSAASSLIATKAASLNVSSEAYYYNNNNNNNNHDNAGISSNTEQGHISSEISNSSGASSAAIHMLVVRQNDQIRIDCSSDLAKPFTELVWLDNQQQQIGKLANQGETPSNIAYVEESISADEQEPKMSKTTLSLFVTIQRHQHANAIFTCEARHKAFDLMDKQLNPFNDKKHQLKKLIKFDVQFEPEIELIKSLTMPAYENQPVNFQCQVQAKPMLNLKYRWFLDNKLISNAHEPELKIEKLTRQLHLRKIACEVSNEIGSSIEEIRLAVLYAPAYVTYLLPSSLQPPWPMEHTYATSKRVKAAAAAASLLAGQQQLVNHNQGELPSEKRMALARELAIGYTPNQEVELRCDFDSNPRIQNVSWFKINSDYYDNMQEVSPSQADQLISSGLAHAAIFKRPLQDDEQHHFEDEEPMVTMAMASAMVQAGDSTAQPQPNHSQKRHISGSGHRNLDIDESIIAAAELDYERMSDNLLAELDQLQQQQQQQQINISNSNPDFKKLDYIASSPIRSTNPQIYEPLDWSIKQRVSLMVSSQTDHIEQDQTLLSLTKPSFLNSTILSKRETQLSSSSVIFKNAPEDAMGRYICRSKSSLPENIQPSVARSVFLIPRKRPRITSARDQFVSSSEGWTGRLQVECLVSIYTVVETTIEWYKDGKLIEPTKLSTVGQQVTNKNDAKPINGGHENNAKESSQHQQQQERSFSIEIQYSPDLLFKRSILKINAANKNDFGQYKCVTFNTGAPSSYKDSLTIELKALDSKGLVIMLSTLAFVVIVLVTLAFIGFSAACAPPRNKQNSSNGKTTIISAPTTAPKPITTTMMTATTTKTTAMSTNTTPPPPSPTMPTPTTTTTSTDSNIRPYVWQAQESNQPQQQTSVEHYQMPMVSVAAPQVSYDLPNPCYATLYDPQLPQGSPQLLTTTNGHYATLAFQQMNTPTLMVPNGGGGLPDNGDGYYNSKNYGTLLSSAYKTLGYHSDSTINNTNQNMSSASSPNSLTTQQSSGASIYTSTNNQQHQLQHPHQQDGNIINQNANYEHVTILFSDGSTTTKPIMHISGDYNMATHV